jgi:hypothetical protein
VSRAQVIGKCTFCREQHPTADGGYVVQHQRPRSWTSGVPGDFTDCNGSLKPSVELRERRRQKRIAKRLAEVVAHRGDAAVVLDAVLVGREDMKPQLMPMLKLALVEYRILNPASRAPEIWSNVDRAHPRSHIRTGRVDVYCTFCRELLASDWARGWDNLGSIEAFTLVDGHCVPCALQHLAGMRTAAQPTARTLPAVAMTGSDGDGGG